MSWIKEFRSFALRGNAIDLAIGVIIGTAFGKVVSSLVSDVLMPPIGLCLGGVDFSDLSVKLHVPGSIAPPVEVKYGAFINTVIDFLIIAFVIFVLVKGLNKLKLNAILEPTKTRECPACCSVIPSKAKRCGFRCVDFPVKSDENRIA